MKMGGDITAEEKNHLQATRGAICRMVENK